MEGLGEKKKTLSSVMIISCPDGTKNYVLCENISVFVAHVTMTEPKMKIVSLLLMNQK
jgi:hypothetical protein